MRNLTWIPIILLLLGACVGPGGYSGGLTPEQGMAIACRGYSGTLGALGPFRPLATAAQVKAVQTVIKIVSPLCRKAARRELTGDAWLIALETVRAQLRVLLVMEIEFKETRT